MIDSMQICEGQVLDQGFFRTPLYFLFLFWSSLIICQGKDIYNMIKKEKEVSVKVNALNIMEYRDFNAVNCQISGGIWLPDIATKVSGSEKYSKPNKSIYILIMTFAYIKTEYLGSY